MKKEIELQLETDLEGEEYKLTNNIVHLSTNFDTEKLNELINKLLNFEEPKKFCFIINNMVLSTTLEELIKDSNQITTEKALIVYYSLQINEPQKMNTIKEEEWIKTIQVLKEMRYNKKNIYCAGLFNGEVSFYNKDNNKIFNLKNEFGIHEDVISILNDVKFFNADNNNNNNENNNILIRTMKNSLTTYDIYSIDIKNQKSTLLFSENKKENEYFHGIDLNPTNFNMFSLSGTDGNKGISKIYKFPANINNLNTENNKKRKMEISSLKPDIIFNDLHNKLCLKTIFLDNEYIVTVGDDYIINIYNLINKSLFMNYNTNYKDVSCIERINNKCFLIGFIDGTIKYYDLNQNKVALLLKDLKTDYGYISDIDLSKNLDKHPSLFSTSSYDHFIKLWDIRAGKTPLHKIYTDETEKNFTVKFNGDDVLLSGGDGNDINIFKY